MLEYFPIAVNKKCAKFLLSQKYISKDACFDLKNFRAKPLADCPSNELFEGSLPRPKREKLKKNRVFEGKPKKFEGYFYKYPFSPKYEPAEIFINIEKKLIFDRPVEVDKKPLPRSSLKNSSPFRTFYSKKPSLPVITQDQPIIQSVFTPRQVNSYINWKLSNNIPADTRFFIIIGNYPDVRKALLQRGWSENNDQESIYFDLKWARNARVPQNLFDWQLYNHFPRNFELSVKWQLYDNIKIMDKVTKGKYLNCIPRSFRLDSKGTESFLDTYKAIFAISLLRDFISNPSKYTVEQVVIANIVGRRWLQSIEAQGQNMSSLVMNVEWRILNSKDSNEIKTIFQRMMLNVNQDVLSLTTAVLKKLEEIDPQYFVNGSKNIWIVKAGRKSRGRDIALFSELHELKAITSHNNSWVVQKYIENPLIIYRKKFDIRQWVLISNSDPLTIWVYKKAYLRFSLEDYNDDNISNPFIHLTNNSISKTSHKFNSSEIKGCMWSIEEFQEYLMAENQVNLWTTVIFPGIKKIVKYSLLSIGNLGRKNSFEILGYDFMIDESMKPWLLEVNSSPAMDYSTVCIT